MSLPRPVRTSRGASIVVALALAAVVCAPVTSVSATPLVSTVASASASAATIAEQFATPPSEYLPSNRYWVASGNGDPADIKKDIADMAAQGIGRATYNDLVLAQIYAGTNGFGTANWAKNFSAALEAGLEKHVTIDALIAPGWSAGVKASPDSPATAKTLALGRSAVIPAGFSFSGQIPLSTLSSGVTKRALQAVLAVRCITDCTGTPIGLVRSSVIDLTGSVQGTDPGTAVGRTLEWTAPTDQPGSSWLVLAYYSQGTGARPTAGIDAQLRGTYLADHFGPAGSQALIDAWTPMLTPQLKDLLRRNAGAMWMDSLELGEATNWTPTLLADFQSRRGYSLVTGLPVVTLQDAATFSFDDGSDERLRNDWLRTMSENFIDYQLKPLDAWADSLGMDLRYQSYSSSGPVAMIPDDAWRALDIPEAETVDHRAVASAAALSGANIVPTECCAFLGTFGENSWRSLWPDMLFRLNQSLSTGANLVEYHGFSQTNGQRGLNFIFGAPSAWPGWSPFVPTTGIGENWDTRQPSWDDQKAINEYIGRSQFILRQGRLKSDFVVYTEGSSGMGAGRLSDPAIAGAGFSWGYLTPAGLADVATADGVIAPDGPAYKALVIDQESRMPVATARKILALSEAGVRVVVVGDAPTRAIDTAAATNDDAELAGVIASLLGRENVATVSSPSDLPSALADLGVAPDARVSDPTSLQILERKDGSTTYYSVFNASQGPVDTRVALAGEGRAYSLDAWTGAIEPTATYATDGGRLVVPVKLAAGATTIVAVTTDDTAFGGTASAHLVSATGDVIVRDGTAYARSFTGTTVTGSSSGAYTVRADIGAIPAAQTLGQWQLQVESWGKPDTGFVTKKTTLDPIAVTAGQDGTLPRWDTLPGLANVSGLGTYRTSVDLGPEWTGGRGAYLDLGPNPNTYRVSVNGKVVTGTSQIDTSRIDLGGYLQAGRNTIEVRVSTTLRNVLRAQAPAQAGGSSTATQVYGLSGPIRLLPYGEAALTPTIDVTGEVTPRALGSTAYLSVSATNRDAVPADIVIATAYGAKTFVGVQPGKTVSVSINSRSASIPAGTATITARGTSGGVSLSATDRVSYTAFTTGR